jgi:acyl carrier protein
MEDPRPEITRKVIALAAEQAGVEPRTVTPDTHFVNDLNYDSLDLVDFSMKVEDAFHLTMPDTDADKLDTVARVVDYVVQKLQEPSRRRRVIRAFPPRPRCAGGEGRGEGASYVLHLSLPVCHFSFPAAPRRFRRSPVDSLPASPMMPRVRLAVIAMSRRIAMR